MGLLGSFLTCCPDFLQCLIFPTENGKLAHSWCVWKNCECLSAGKAAEHLQKEHSGLVQHNSLSEGTTNTPEQQWRGTNASQKDEGQEELKWFELKMEQACKLSPLSPGALGQYSN